MSKTFTYTDITGHYYCQYSDDWELDGNDFEYEVDNSDLADEIAKLLFADYFSSNDKIPQDEEIVKAIKKSIRDMIYDGDWVEFLADEYEDTLKEIFQEEAMEWYNG